MIKARFSHVAQAGYPVGIGGKGPLVNLIFSFAPILGHLLRDNPFGDEEAIARIYIFWPYRQLKNQTAV
jgi:hypothetical protein